MGTVDRKGLHASAMRVRGTGVDLIRGLITALSTDRYRHSANVVYDFNRVGNGVYDCRILWGLPQKPCRVAPKLHERRHKS